MFPAVYICLLTLELVAVQLATAVAQLGSGLFGRDIALRLA
jgi:hypothetical protein